MPQIGKTIESSIYRMTNFMGGRPVTITGDLVDILLSTKTKDIPEEAQELARQVCLDGIGVMIAGAGEPLGLGRLAFEYTK